MVAAPVRLTGNALNIPLVVAATAAVAVAAGLAVPVIDRPAWVLVALAAAAAIVIVAWRLELGLWGFILATALNRYNFDVAGWQMKIEHMVLLLVLLAWGLRFLSGRERLERWPLMALIGGFLGVNLVASVLHSADLYKSIRILTRMALAVGAYLLIVNYIRDRGRLSQLVTVFLAVAAGAASYGIVASAAWRMAGVNLGLQYSTITDDWYPYGTLWEANLFGSYVMSACVVSLVLLLSGQRTINRWFLSTVFALTAVAMLLSLARGAWLGFGVSGFFILLFVGRSRFGNLLMLVMGSALALLVLSSMNPGGVFQGVWDRVGTLPAASQDINVVSRFSNSELALQEWPEHRWLGWGTDGFHINHPEILSALPSPQLHTLYDTGLVGVTLFVVLVLAFAGRGFAAAVTAEEQEDRALVFALLFSFLGLLVAFQATDAFWLGFTWVHLALLTGAALTVAPKSAPHRLLRQQLRLPRPRTTEGDLP